MLPAGSCFAEQGVWLYHADALPLLARMAPDLIDLVVTDPPYYRVKSDAWDRAWPTPQSYLEWVGQVAAELGRVCKATASLYWFASPRMAAGVEMAIGRSWRILNRICWVKGPAESRGKWAGADKSALRAYFSRCEYIIFAEQPGAELETDKSRFLGASRQLRAEIMEPLRAYLDRERVAAGISRQECNDACGVATMASNHYFSRSQWQLPTREHYERLRALFNRGRSQGAPPYLACDWGELVRQYCARVNEFNRRRVDLLDTRRPFLVSPAVPYTDVWEFQPVAPQPGKHPAQKPIDLLRHAIEVSSRQDNLVLDPFAGGRIHPIGRLATGPPSGRHRTGRALVYPSPPPAADCPPGKCQYAAAIYEPTHTQASGPAGRYAWNPAKPKRSRT